jgi:hypothetical protein
MTMNRVQFQPVLPVHRLPPPVQRHQRHDLRGNQAGAVALVPDHAPAYPVQEKRGGARTHAPPWVVCDKTAWLVKHKLVEVMRVREEDRQLDGRVEIDAACLGGKRSGGKVGRGCENKVPFVAAAQTTPDGQPQFVCLRQQPFTLEAVAVFAARSIAPSVTVITGGLHQTLRSEKGSTRVALAA